MQGRPRPKVAENRACEQVHPNEEIASQDGQEVSTEVQAT